MSKPATIALMVFISILVVAGQTLLKVHFGRHPLPVPLGLRQVGPVLRWAVCDPYIWLMGVCVVLSGGTWVYVINKVPLSYAYPMASFVYIFMMLAARLLFHEPVTWNKILGTLVICGGVALLSIGHATSLRSANQPVKPAPAQTAPPPVEVASSDVSAPSGT